MGYALQSHVRALIVTDEAAGTVLARSLIRLLVRSDSRQPVIYCDALFFTSGGYRQPLWAEIMRQAEALKAHMGIPVVHACSTLPRHPIDETRGGYVRAVKRLGYDVAWVDLLELDGVAPYTYSEVRPARRAAKRARGARAGAEAPLAACGPRRRRVTRGCARPLPPDCLARQRRGARARSRAAHTHTHTRARTTRPSAGRRISRGTRCSTSTARACCTARPSSARSPSRHCRSTTRRLRAST